MATFNLRKPEPSTLIYGTLSLLALVLFCLWFSMVSLHQRVNRAIKIDLVAPVQSRPGDSRSATPDTKNPAAPAAVPKDFQDLIKSKGLFGKVPEAQPQLQGVLGDSVLINGLWIKAGETNGDIKVLETSSGKAVIEYKGERRELQIWPNLPGS